jgi:hypothetical protein
MKGIKIFDNEGATQDRYTIVNTKTGDVIGCNCAPFHPCGIGQHCGNLVDNIMFHKFGAGWRRGYKTEKDKKIIKRIERAEIRNYLQEAKDNPEWLGKPAKFNDMPEDVKKFIAQSFE